MSALICSRRLEKSGDRRDFLSVVVDKVRLGKVSEEEMAAHCSIIAFVATLSSSTQQRQLTQNNNSIAGSETSATSIATITCFLLNSPGAHQKLKEEIRGRFKSIHEIDIASTSELPYLHAVIEEGMRIVPTASEGFSRKSPRGGVSVDSHFVPAGVSEAASASIELQLIKHSWVDRTLCKCMDSGA